MPDLMSEQELNVPLNPQTQRRNTTIVIGLSPDAAARLILILMISMLFIVGICVTTLVVVSFTYSKVNSMEQHLSNVGHVETLCPPFLL